MRESKSLALPLGYTPRSLDDDKKYFTKNPHKFQVLTYLFQRNINNFL